MIDRWGQLYGAARALALAEAAQRRTAPMLVVVQDVSGLERLAAELSFFAGDTLPVHTFPDWETLAYDAFSPHPDIVSARLRTLARLPGLGGGVVLVAAPTLLQRLPPRTHIDSHALTVQTGQVFDTASMRRRLESAGYVNVPQVTGHGEFAVRGSLFDVFPMGAPEPYRVELFDDRVESLRTFDPETQLTREKSASMEVLPAREYPFDEDAIRGFRQRWRRSFEGDPQQSLVYRDVSQGITPGGIEYWLPLFFDDTATLFDYLPDATTIVLDEGAEEALERSWQDANERHAQLRGDRERPLLDPETIMLPPDDLQARVGRYPCIHLQTFELEYPGETGFNHPSRQPPSLLIDAHADDPSRALREHIASFEGRVLIAAESPGRREALLEMLHAHGLRPVQVDGWQRFVEGGMALAITIAPLDKGLLRTRPGLSIIAESQLYGERVRTLRRRGAVRDPEAVIRDLGDLHTGAPVVHVEHGVGRYRGLQTLDVDGIPGEFLALEYAGGDRLYVPVASLHLVGRYTGAAPEHAPLHRLGGDQWQRIRRRAARRLYDVAAELLATQARRAARSGRAFHADAHDYAAFCADFPFETTVDQQMAIDAVLEDLRTPQPMDRVVCGDVGFGKTEVAMRAAFVAVQAGFQAAILVPTTLLAQQHHQNFLDRFADWATRIEVLSRMRSGKQLESVLAGMESGSVDIVIGTHKLLGDLVRFKQLGLVIVDEEHRFGVRHKERLKKLRAEVDMLTLTATPIPRTLNMTLSGLRDLSIIATPPEGRLAIKTFVSEWQDSMIRDACLREIRRGGQVYFLYNDVQRIERIAERIRSLVPEASVRVAHGQMRERDLEQVMLDFYHRRFNLLVCTTIIESGIDVPSANTIVIDRADKLGLAQLHQLRGRVGRSHHRAYAYLLAPERRAMTADAVKRLEAVESLEDLGAGFTLATHDLEIRGAGELLGEEQSGQIEEIGFALYNDMLARAVTSLKRGERVSPDDDLAAGTEVDLKLPAFLPDVYMPDVHMRLMFYKRMASAGDDTALEDLKAELIDRFGPLPQPAKNLFKAASLRLHAGRLGVVRVDCGARGGRLVFGDRPKVEPRTVLEIIGTDPARYRFDGRHTLRFTGQFDDDEARIAFCRELLTALSR